MKKKVNSTLNVLLAHFNKADSHAKYLSEAEQLSLKNFNVPSALSSAIVSAPTDFLRHVHYSWLWAALKKMPKSSLSYFLAALPVKKTTKLKEMFSSNKDVVENTLELLPSAKAFFLQQLYLALAADKHLPSSWLEKEELSILLDLDKKRFSLLIDFLGLHDLAKELPRVLDNSILQAVYSQLSPKKIAYIKTCMRVKDKVPFPSLGLHAWDKNPASLEKILHKRGIMRLGIALAKVNEDLLWHLLRRLDIGRSQLLEKNIAKEEIPQLSQSIRKEVIKLSKELLKG